MDHPADSTANCARVGRVGMLAGRAFQWMIVLGNNVNL